MSHLHTPGNGKIILPPWRKTSADVYEVRMPVQSVQALFELIGFLEEDEVSGEGEFERKLRKYTDLSEPEIKERRRYLDALYEYLWNNKLRPHKVKRAYGKSIRTLMGRLLRPRGEGPWS